MFKTSEEAILAAQKELEASGDYIEFEGMNCNDYLDEGQYECAGWGGDSRCACGNRRVYWATYQDEKQNYVAYAAAD